MSKRSRSTTSASARARVEQMRREQRAKERRRRLLTVAAVVGVMVVTVVVVLVVVLTRSGSSPTSIDVADQILPAPPSGTSTVQQQPPKRVPDTSGIPGAMAWDTEAPPGTREPPRGVLEREHVLGPVKYAVLPPVGGPHNPLWMNAGIYTKPVPSERAVHDLEHGAIWIVYDPTLPTSQITQLRSFVARQTMIPESRRAAGVANQANRYMILSPWAGHSLPSPIVLSSWGHQLRVSNVTDQRMQRFVDTFRHSPKFSPEYGSPVDGVPIQTGGRPAGAGSRQPNPTGSVH